MSHIVIFDGVCNFCDGAVRFIIKRDPAGVFRFTPMQSDLGQRLIAEHDATLVGVDTFLLIKDKHCYERTDAALEICKDLRGPWPYMRAFRFVPRPIRDFFYVLFARNRYAIFGRRNHCDIPSPDILNRFVV